MSSAVQDVTVPTVQEAYVVCRAIARRKAKNFYYAFVALPAGKRDAICAVYAFMLRRTTFPMTSPGRLPTAVLPWLRGSTSGTML